MRYNFIMSRSSAVTGDQLTNALRALDIIFLMGRGKGGDASLHKQPARLIAALAGSDDARLRLSLIPLFLEHPEFAAHVRDVAQKLPPAPRLTLQCYYSAAVWFSHVYRAQGTVLPDHFSDELSLCPSEDPEENLRDLAKRHEELSSARVNWLGTYQHAARVWFKGLELKTD